MGHNNSFTQKVLEIVVRIQEGETLSYKEVAKLAGSPKAARAVGNILSKNNNWPNVPCHRVIRSDGKIGNWKWGKTKKALLLQQEGFLVFKNKSPKNY